MSYIGNVIFSKDLKEKSKLNEKDFTRNRKVGFVTLICMILNIINRSTQLEIDDFIREFGTEKDHNLTYTKQSFSESRFKLSPKAFNMLNSLKK